MQEQATANRQQSHLRAIRRAQGLSLTQVATPAGIDRSYLARIERGECSPTLNNFAGIVDALGLRSLARQLEPFTTRGRS